MISRNLKQRVLEELTLLKQHATTEEINLLNEIPINPSSHEECIYGAMTGDCFSERAHELLSKCTRPYSETIDVFRPTKMGVKRWMKVREVKETFFSPVEYYIYQRQKNIPFLTDYLLGKRELTIDEL